MPSVDIFGSFSVKISNISSSVYVNKETYIENFENPTLIISLFSGGYIKQISLKLYE